MESSDAETGMVDCSVGTIVWVRRRNGSWWPGKILGPDELSASHLMSPRSGTPVKLLGREDASVDWYNLEKSKRVKPFRCGEFDDCIERAEASQGMPPKKREKYARREDAILHALELEKRYGKQSNGLMNITPELCVDDKRKGQLDDNVQAPSFRDLVPIKHNKLSSSNGSHSHGVIGPENTLTVGGKKVVEKRKRPQEGNNIIIEESVGKRRDRHRPLVQVLQSSAKLQPNTKAADGGGGEEQRETLPPDQVKVEVEVEVEKIALNLSDGNSTGSNEDTETDSSGTESLMSDTYDDAMAALSDEAEDMEFIPKAFGRCESMSDESSIGTVSKWQLKGKRNSRSSSSNSNSRQWMMGFKGEDEYDGCRLLIDVEVGVQSGYQREHVPMISLMSKLNDKAIVGHPIPVQALEEDASSLLSEMEMLQGYDLQPWRTAKCRPPHLSTLEEEEYYVGSKGRLKKPQRRSTSSSCTSQKIRTLSSIQGEQGMMMKPESLPTAVACIPVKLVFSRLHEELLAPRHQ